MRVGSQGWEDAAVPAEELIRVAARPVLADITLTTGLVIDFSPWHGDDASIGYVLHEGGVDPVSPVWEAYQLLSDGDGLARWSASVAHPGPRDGHLDAWRRASGAPRHR